MSVKELDNIIRKEETFPGNHFCSIYSLTAAIASLYPNEDKREILKSITNIIQVPISETPLLEMSKKFNLPAPILSTKDDMHITVRDWFLQGHAQPLVEYLNENFSKTNFPITITYEERNKDSQKNFIQNCKNGKIAILPFKITDTTNSFSENHHMAIKYSENNWHMIDVNMPIMKIEEELLLEMFDNGDIGLPYTQDNEVLSILTKDPIIYIESNKRDIT